ncbi:MAG: DUF111 family protein [Eubacteriales bacterium]|nr:DUF111 family protein [Eubacteriales bacterium]
MNNLEEAQFRNLEQEDQVLELRCNIDDMTGEDLAYAMDVLLERGALDVYTIPIGMKKGRTGIMLSVLCKEGQRKEMARTIFQYTTTIGIRENVCNRMILGRREYSVDSEWGPIHVKQSGGYGVLREKMEFEELKKIAQREGLSLAQVREIIKK